MSCELDLEEWLRVHCVERRWEHSSKVYNICKDKEVSLSDMDCLGHRKYEKVVNQLLGILAMGRFFLK